MKRWFRRYPGVRSGVTLALVACGGVCVGCGVCSPEPLALVGAALLIGGAVVVCLLH
ncbi:MAG: hypothetical protein ONB14_04645 [candidate division KSB1 bacterium]|nr:hypothetical protein [candidate division KSB1 bacterium]